MFAIAVETLHRDKKNSDETGAAQERMYKPEILQCTKLAHCIDVGSGVENDYQQHFLFLRQVHNHYVHLQRVMSRPSLDDSDFCVCLSLSHISCHCEIALLITLRKSYCACLLFPRVYARVQESEISVYLLKFCCSLRSIEALLDYCARVYLIPWCWPYMCVVSRCAYMNIPAHIDKGCTVRTCAIIALFALGWQC